MKITIKAYKDVVVGDRIYNKYSYCKSSRWFRVKSIETIDGRTRLRTCYFDEWGHSDEAIAIKEE